MGIILNVPVGSLLVAVMHYNILRWVVVERRDPARARVHSLNHRCRLGEARTPPPRHRPSKYGPFMYPSKPLPLRERLGRGDRGVHVPTAQNDHVRRLLLAAALAPADGVGGGGAPFPRI